MIGKNKCFGKTFLSILQRVLSGRKDLDFADYRYNVKAHYVKSYGKS